MVRPILLACASALLVAASALPVSSADPVKLALQQNDISAKTFPSAGVNRLEPYEIADLDISGLKGASYSYSWPANGGTTPSSNTWYLFGYVFVAPNVAGAKQLYQSATRLKFGLAPFVDVQYPPRDQKELHLHKYGDEELGIFGQGEGPEATLYVRRGAVLWALSIVRGPVSWKPTEKQVVDQLFLYAGKQAGRVKTG